MAGDNLITKQELFTLVYVKIAEKKNLGMVTPKMIAEVFKRVIEYIGEFKSIINDDQRSLTTTYSSEYIYQLFANISLTNYFTKLEINQIVASLNNSIQQGDAHLLDLINDLETSLAEVAISGDYNDLINLPDVIPINIYKRFASAGEGDTQTDFIVSELIGKFAYDVSRGGGTLNLVYSIPGGGLLADQVYFNIETGLLRFGNPFYDSPEGVRILATSLPPPSAPLVNAGPDKVIYLPVNNVQITQALVTPKGGSSISSLLWELISTVPSALTATIEDNDIINPVIEDLSVVGVYNFRLTGNASNGTSASDTMKVEVRPTLTFDTVQLSSEFVSATDNGITSTASGLDAFVMLEFDAVVNPVGLPFSMIIYVDGTAILLVDFPSEYLGRQFRFTDPDNNKYLRTFVEGNVNI